MSARLASRYSPRATMPVPIQLHLDLGRRRWAAGVLATLLAPAACSQRTYTRVEEVWRTKEKVTLKRLLVIAGWEDLERRTIIEGQIAAAFTGRGVPAKSAEPLIDDPYPYPPGALMAATEQDRLDGALVVRMISFDNSASVDVTGPPVGDDPRAKYSSALRHVYQAEGVTGAKTARAETLLYQVATEKLIWSGLSETFAPADVADALSSYGNAMTKTLLAGGLVAAS
jgi:hypothetical protein